MKLLLDTHAFLWWDSNDARLPSTLRSAIATPSNQVFVSAVSVWEIAIKRGLGKLVFAGGLGLAIEGHGFVAMPITVEQAESAGSLPLLHRDPFDRLLVAQAQMQGLVLVTVDEEILRYAVPHLCRGLIRDQGRTQADLDTDLGFEASHPLAGRKAKGWGTVDSFAGKKLTMDN